MATMVAVVAALTAGLVGVLLLAQAPAQAHDHRIPQPLLKKGAKELHPGTLVKESSWDRLVEDGLYENEGVIYRTRFPHTDSVAAGAKLRVRISKRQKPDSFEVAAHRALDEEGRQAAKGGC
jgi:hypothetical protein